MRRVSVVGNSGSGKSTLGRALAARLAVPYVELDAVHHLPGWQERPLEEYRLLVAEAAAGDGWVIDGNYRQVQDIVWTRADTVVWLDPPRRRVMTRVVRRTLVRVVTRRELWNGNREPWSNLWSLDPYKSIVAWSWTRHAVYRARYEASMADPRWSHLRFVRLQTEADRASLLSSLSGSG
ncbi:MAG TPA: hypothetical protein VM030_01100 [Acidimicrobiales bacterium]|nr:hypothetical protein [Acidimicrobiales bacterium]